MSADQSLQHSPPFEAGSHYGAIDDLWSPTNQPLVWCVVATGLAALAVSPAAHGFMSLILKIAWFYVVTGTRG